MDRSLNYNNGVWSVPNLRPTRAQTAASAYRPPRIRTNTNRPSTGTGTATTKQPSVISSPIHYDRNEQPRRRQRSPASSFSRDTFSPHASKSIHADDSQLTEENMFLRDKVRDLERKLLKSQQAQQQMQSMVRNKKVREKLTFVKEPSVIFDPASSVHPDTYDIIEPNEVWRPTVAPRPLSPIRQFGKIERFAAATTAAASTTGKKNKTNKTNKKNKNKGSWSLGREFQPKEVAAFGMDKYLLSEWLDSYNNEQHSYRSLSTQITTELHEASIFSSKLPSPNMLMTAIAVTSLDKLGVLFGRYKGLFSSIRHLLIQAIFEDAEDVFQQEKIMNAPLTVEQFCSHESYFAALNRHQIQLVDMKQHFENLRLSLNEHKGNAKKRRSTLVAEMWKNAAVKSSAKMAKQQLSAQLKQAEQSLHTLHTSININTHDSILKMLDKLSTTEAASILASLMPLVGRNELGAALKKSMRLNFSSPDVLQIIIDLATSLDALEKTSLFPTAAKALPNSFVHKGVLALLRNMKPKNRDVLLSELLGNDTESLLSLLRLITNTEGDDLVELMKNMATLVVGNNDDHVLKLCGHLMNHAVSQSNQHSSSVMKKLFHHLPDEIEHAVHHESHERRQETGVKLAHEIEAEKLAVQALEDAARDAVAVKLAKETRAGMINIETQTEDPNDTYGTLDQDKIWGGILPGQEDTNGQRGGQNGQNSHVIVEKAHWYEDLMKLSEKSRYRTIAPMNFSKALNLVYDTFVKKIVKNSVDDRNHTMRESMGSFLRNSFKKLYGIPRVVNENLVGVVHSIELFAARSRRVRLFGELCGRQQKEHISDRLSDVYLNMLTLIWPKFNKTVLKSKHEGQCFITSTQIRKVLMGVFPKRHHVGSSKQSQSYRKRKPKEFYIGATILSHEVREELYETVARTVFEKKGLT